MKKLTVLMLLAVISMAALTGCGNNCRQAHMEMALLWQQQAAETKALFYQGYNVARRALDRRLKTLAKGKKGAVVLDLDETVLDNTPYQVVRLKAGKGFDLASWNAWCDKGIAKALPGAKAFLDYAHSKGVAIFYVSNRKQKTKPGTMKNLKQLGLPQAVTGHVLLRTGSSSKKSRRAVVSEDYQIMVLCGDNLGDFDELFESKQPDKRAQAVHRHSKQFGDKFIMFPNPMYGAWEGAVYRGKWGASPSEKRKMRFSQMKGY